MSVLDEAYRKAALNYFFGCNQEERTMSQSRGRVYIAGPMTMFKGAQYNFPAFYKAQAMLELWGYSVTNPARMDIESGYATYNIVDNAIVAENKFTRENAMLRDFRKILNDVDAVVVLPEWDQSTGAQREVAVAVSVGKPVYRFTEDAPLNLERDVPMDVQVDLQCYDANLSTVTMPE